MRTTHVVRRTLHRSALVIAASACLLGLLTAFTTTTPQASAARTPQASAASCGRWHTLDTDRRKVWVGSVGKWRTEARLLLKTRRCTSWWGGTYRKFAAKVCNKRRHPQKFTLRVRLWAQDRWVYDSFVRWPAAGTCRTFPKYGEVFVRGDYIHAEASYYRQKDWHRMRVGRYT